MHPKYQTASEFSASPAATYFPHSVCGVLYLAIDKVILVYDCVVRVDTIIMWPLIHIIVGAPAISHNVEAWN